MFLGSVSLGFGVGSGKRQGAKRWGIGEVITLFCESDDALAHNKLVDFRLPAVLSSCFFLRLDDLGCTCPHVF